MAWVFLVLSGFLEVGFVFGLKFSQGMTRLWPTVAFLVCELASFFLLSQVLKTIPTGTAYAIFTGIGAIGTVLVGILFMGESRDILRLGAILLIVAGVMGLRVLGGE